MICSRCSVYTTRPVELTLLFYSALLLDQFCSIFRLGLAHCLPSNSIYISNYFQEQSINAPCSCISLILLLWSPHSTFFCHLLRVDEHLIYLEMGLSWPHRLMILALTKLFVRWWASLWNAFASGWKFSLETVSYFFA